jgi:uroporphyrinogen-III synthase
VAATRRDGELAELVRGFGGKPLWAPTMATTPAGEATLDSFADAVLAGQVDGLVCLTGIGVRAVADALCRRASPGIDPSGLLARMRSAARGAKTVAALRRLGVEPEIIVSPDATVEGLVAGLRSCDVKQRRVAIQWAGAAHEGLRTALREGGAALMEILPYAYGLPEDVGRARFLVGEVGRGGMGAVAFTHPRQAHNLFLVAEEDGRDVALAAAVGRGTPAALREHGVERVLVPHAERIGGALVASLAVHLAAARAGPDPEPPGPAGADPLPPSRV